MTHTAESLAALTDAAFNRAVGVLAEPRAKIQEHEDGTFTLVIEGRAGYMTRPELSEERLAEMIPDVANDLNAAWALCEKLVRDNEWELVFSMSPSIDPLIYYAYIQHYIPNWRDEAMYTGKSETSPARALASAWVLWKQEQEVGT